MSRKKIIIIAAGVLVAVAIVVINLRFRRDTSKKVNAETIQKRDLEAIVSASGKIQPKRSVNISANTMGRVTRLVVKEGDRVRAGQFLLQIDPKTFQSAVERSEASLQGARSSIQQARVAVQTARANLDLAKENLKRQRELWAQQLTTRADLDRTESEVRVREHDLEAQETGVRTQEQRLRQEQAGLDTARHDLSKVTIDAPMNGLITRLNIEEGETVVIGTMNNAGTVLMTIADLSVIEAEIDVDETDIVNVALRQPAKVTIDAFPDKTFSGQVTEIGNSASQVQGAQSAAAQATNFKVVVTLNEQVPDVRPGFTCTADITTAKRSGAIAVPIQALTVREMTLDAAGKIVRDPDTNKPRRRGTVETSVAASELKPGQTRKELEGVFVVRGDKTEFASVKTGIAGEKYFEVLSGLNPGDRVIIGPFNSVRDLSDGDKVKIEEAKRAADKPKN